MPISILFFPHPPAEWQPEVEASPGGIVFATKDTISACFVKHATVQGHGALLFRIQTTPATPPLFAAITLVNLRQMLYIAEQLEAGETLETAKLPEDTYALPKEQLQ